jgi:Ca-activated chloride channel family protein
MKFAHTDMLWAILIVVPLLIAFLWWSRRKRAQLISQFVQSRLLASLTVGVSARRQLIKNTLIIGAVGSLLLALARPYWDDAWQEASQQGLDIVVAVDTSRSMLAADLSPDRLTRTKLAIRDLLLKARTDRMGLVPFAGTAFVQCPLTIDQEAFQQNVNILDVDIIPEPGSDLGAAIDAAVTAFEEGEGVFRVIILFSDGEDHNQRAVAAAKEAAKKDIRIYTVGVGTTGGELLQFKDARGNTSYLRDGDGNVIKSRLNEELLKEVASAAQGFYLPLAGPDTMNVLYERGLAPLPRGELAAAKIRRPIDRFQWPLGFAILLLVTELFISERRRVGRAEAKAAAPKPIWQTAVVFLLMAGTVMGSPKSARRAYDRNEYGTALEEYRRLLDVLQCGRRSLRGRQFRRCRQLLQRGTERPRSRLAGTGLLQPRQRPLPPGRSKPGPGPERHHGALAAGHRRLRQRPGAQAG